MMKRSNKIIVVITLVLTLVLSLFAFTSCSELLGVQDGKDGKDFDLHAVYEERVAAGAFEGTYDEFIKEYLNIELKYDEETSYTTAINAALRSVVSITASAQYSSSGALYTKSAYGSGVIYQLDKTAGDAMIITNCHVVYDAFPQTLTEGGKTCTRVTQNVNYECFLYGMEDASKAIPFTVVGYAMTQDVAVCKVTGNNTLKTSQAAAAVIGNSDNLIVGQKSFLIGNALGQGITATSGIVSMLRESVMVGVSDNSCTGLFSGIRLDAAANHGNSGGGMFDAQGRLIGVLFAGNDAANGIANSLPINTAIKVAKSIEYWCDGNSNIVPKKVTRGISVLPVVLGQTFDNVTGKLSWKDEMEVQEVYLSTLADGKFQAGDKIVSFKLANETTATSLVNEWQFSDFLWLVRPNESFVVTVERGGSNVDLTITATTASFNDADAATLEQWRKAQQQ